MTTLKASNNTIEDCFVYTYRSTPNTKNSYRVKVGGPAEVYAFSKRPFARGGEGRMFAARDIASSDVFCVKEIRLNGPKKGATRNPNISFMSVSDQESSALTRALSEVEISWRSKRLFGPVRVFTNRKKSKLYVVQKPLSGGIRDAVRKMSAHPQLRRSDVVRALALAIALDLQSIHKSGILHLDINPNNICFKKSAMEVEILDFGFSINGSEGCARASSTTHAPREQQIPGKIVGKSADVFSLGATFADLALDETLLGDYVDQGGVGARIDSTFLAAMKMESEGNDSQFRAKKSYCKKYFRRLKVFHPVFHNLIVEMMDPDEERRPSIGSVIDRLKKMQPHASLRSAMITAWNELPEFSGQFQRSLETLDLDLRYIREKKIMPINVK